MKKILTYIVLAFLSLGMITAQDFNRDAMPKAGATPKINIAKPKSFVLKNGLTVMVVENHKLPKVNVRLTADQAPIYEGNIVGVSSILSDQVGNGTKNMSKDDFNKRIDFLGARLSFGSSSAYANMLSKYFDEVMGMMADAVINPLFDAKEIEKSKEQLIEGLKASAKSAKSIAGDVFPALMYGKNTALGEFETEESIKRITKADVEKAFKQRFTPGNYYLVIVGDVKLNQVKKVLAKGLAKWKKAPNASKKPLIGTKNLAKTEINIVNVPSAVQSVIKVGNIHSLQKKDKDYFAAKIANYVLGGGSLDSRLNMNLREDKAFTYGAYSSLSSEKYSKEFEASTNVRNAVTADAVKEIIKEMTNIPTITAKDLKDAKAQLKGSFIMALEQPATIARFAVNQIINDLPKKFYKDYLKSIDAVSLNDVKLAAQKYILPSQARIFIAGKANDFLPELEKLGYKISFYDKNAMPTSKPVKKQISADVTVATVADNYIKAIGGRAAVEKVKSIKTTSTATIQGMQMQMVNVSANGAKMMMNISMMGQSMQKIVCDGEKGYIMAGGQKQPMPKEMISKLQKSQQNIFPELTFANNKDIKLKGIENIKGEDTYAIEDGKNTSYYSIATGLKVSTVTIEKGPDGQEVASPSYFAEYKVVDGVKIPYKTTQKINGQDIVFQISDCKFNIAKDEDFK